MQRKAAEEGGLLLIKPPPPEFGPSGLSPSLWLIGVPCLEVRPRSHLAGCICGRGRETPPPPTPTQCHRDTPGLLVRFPDPHPPEQCPRTRLRASPCHTQTRDHSLPQLPSHTYLLPPSLSLPRFCLVTERHLGTLPRLELASCTVPRNLRRQAEPPAARLCLANNPLMSLQKKKNQNRGAEGGRQQSFKSSVSLLHPSKICLPNEIQGWGAGGP